jgi:hypothetical protein
MPGFFEYTILAFPFIEQHSFIRNTTCNICLLLLDGMSMGLLLVLQSMNTMNRTLNDEPNTFRNLGIDTYQSLEHLTMYF